MAQRRKKIIDRRFQLRTTFSILGISLVAFLSIIALVSIIATGNNRTTVKTICNLDRCLDTEYRVVSSLFEKLSSSGKTDRAELNKLLSEHEASISALRKYPDVLRGFADRNFIVITIIIAVVLVQSLVLLIYLLHLTHRISGPLYVMQQHMNDIMEGRSPRFRDLRENDEFQEFYRSFCRMASDIKKED